MKRIGFIIILLFLLYGCATRPNLAGEHLILAKKDFNTWTLNAYENSPNGKGAIRQYVPSNEPAKNASSKSSAFSFHDFFLGKRTKQQSWSKVVTIGWVNTPDVPLKSFVESQYKIKIKTCPGTKLKIIKSDHYSIYYEFDMPACHENDGKSASEISRAIRGNEAIFIITYGVNNRKLTSRERSEWLTVMRNSYIAKGKNNIRVR